jgi:hypothetical protein
MPEERTAVTAASSTEELIDAYCAAWDEPDASRRDAILRPIWADGATYTDPTVHLVGRQQLVDHIGKVLERYPNSRIVRTSVVDAHHGLARFARKKVLANGRSLPEGIDVAEIGNDRKLRRVIGFFGSLARRDGATRRGE